jgi:hypothetical protein
VTEAETSPDVCYRHPKRESWVLCQRCGRTICPECQILAPVGVQCPECVREAGGSVSWRNAGEIRRPVSKLSKARRPQAARSNSGSGWQSVVGRMLRPGTEAPVLSWGIVATLVVLWIAGFALPAPLGAGLPFEWLATRADQSLAVWRYLTAPVAFPSVFDGRVILSLLLTSIFFLLNAPAVEATFGRTRFLAVFLAAGAVGSASAMLGSGLGYGLVGALFGLFGAHLILVWSHPAARVQVLVMIAINFVLSLALGGGGLPQLVGGLIAGAAATYILQRYEGARRSTARTPFLIIGAGAGGFVLIAILVTNLF